MPKRRRVNRQAYEGTHDLRWKITLEKMNEMSSVFLSSRNLLALGTDGQFESQLQVEYPNLDVHISDWDLRFTFPVVSESYDLCVALEVIEHLKDRDDQTHDIAAHYFTGLLNFLIETHKSLKPGGLLILTTPNSSSLESLFRTIQGKSTFMYWPHVRELSPLELAYFLQQTGFQVNLVETFSPYSTDFKASKVHLLFVDFFRLVMRGDSLMRNLRGSTLYVVAQKVNTPKEILLETEWHQVKLSDFSS